jgi:hypothetical protein
MAVKSKPPEVRVVVAPIKNFFKGTYESFIWVKTIGSY